MIAVGIFYDTRCVRLLRSYVDYQVKLCVHGAYAVAMNGQQWHKRLAMPHEY